MTEIDLGGNHIGAEGAAALSQTLSSNSSLTEIDLGSNNISSEGAAALSKALASNSSLTKINLRSNNIDAKGAKALKEIDQSLKRNKNLKMASKSSNDLEKKEEREK